MITLIITAIAVIVAARVMAILNRIDAPKYAYWIAGSIVSCLQVNAMYWGKQ